MKEKQKKADEKVVLFPGVVEKLVGKGMDALKEKLFSQSLSYFEQALEIEPDHPQGRFGVALSLIEQSRLEDAKQVTEQMLKEDIGNYYDILQVHISLLVQLGEYDDVVAMLEGIMAEEKLPVNLAESFYHLLHFSLQMVEDQPVFENNEIKEVPEDLVQLLNEGSPQKQLLAIQTLSKMPNQIFIKAIKPFLLDDKHNPILKSLTLQMLKEKKIDDTVEVHKFGQVHSIHILNLEDAFHEKFGKDTLSLVAKFIEQKDPTLFEMVSHIWWNYLFALYPFQPQPFSSDVWAAAIHLTGVTMIGQQVEEDEIALLYSVSASLMSECSIKIIELEKTTFIGS